MRLKHLQLRQFRNINELSFQPSGVINILVGDNGQGKTSVIEGIYYLSALKSFRTHKIHNLIQHSQEGFFAEGQIEKRGAGSELFLRAKVYDGRRQLLINEKPVTATRFVSQLKTVVFSPESLAAVKYGPDLRRELVDQALFQFSETARAAQQSFSRALKQRNACLRQIKEGLIDPNRGRAILESLNLGYIDSATELTYERLHFLRSLTPYIQNALSEIMGTKTSLYVLYESAEKEWDQTEKQAVFERIQAETNDPTRRSAEEALGQTLTGPHRHDLSFIFNGNDSRIFCSQGQQRALILGFKIAEIVYHSEVFESYPLLLLDDVLSEFDESKRRFLIDFLKKSEAQTFLTTTDQSPNFGDSVYRLENGRLTQP